MFEALISNVTTDSAFQWMASHGYSHLVIQYGKGNKPVLPVIPPGLTVECYDFKSSLEADMKGADVIVSHAGAGTVMEGVRLRKHMVVIINNILMDNHQTELADAMGKRGHVYVVPSPELLANLATWDAIQAFRPVPKPPGDDYDFPRLLNHFMGFDKVD